MSAQLPKLTWEDYRSIPPDGKRYELIEGELHVKEGPALSGFGDVQHQRLAGRLFVRLDEVVRRRGLGEVFFAPVEVELTDIDVLQPDLLFLRRDHAPRLTSTHLVGPPDLAIEIVSRHGRRYDEIVKRHLYDRGGVSEYWVVDPVVETVKVYRRGEAGGFERAVELAAERGERLESPLLPGLALPLVDLFAG
jgi:Uma2 family endonuclease